MKIVNQLVLWTLILFVALYYLKEKATNPFENSLGQPLTIIPHPQELSLKADSFDFVIDANTVIIIKDTSEARDKAPCEVLNLALEAKHISPLAVDPKNTVLMLIRSSSLLLEKIKQLLFLAFRHSFNCSSNAKVLFNVKFRR